MPGATRPIPHNLVESWLARVLPVLAIGRGVWAAHVTPALIGLGAHRCHRCHGPRATSMRSMSRGDIYGADGDIYGAEYGGAGDVANCKSRAISRFGSKRAVVRVFFVAVRRQIGARSHTVPVAIGTNSENADTSIVETVPPAEPTPEPPGLPDRGDERAPEFVESPQPPAGDVLGADADEPAGFPADEFDSPSAHLDPVAELRRQGLGLPTGNSRTRRGRRLARPEEVKPAAYNPQQRLMILDCWQRSGLPAKDFATLVGVSKHT